MSSPRSDRALRVIEASAGTGKTFRITQLVAELVSSGTPIDRIVLSSYTNAAADELAERVRVALARAADPRAHGDQDAAIPDATAAARLRRAVAEIDGACIGTIHSFCARLLEEASEVAGALSLDGMSPDEAAGDLQSEVTADLWAACVAPSQLAISMLGDDPAAARAMLASIVSAVDGEPDARIEPEGGWMPIAELERRIDDLIIGEGAACRASVADVIPHFNKAAAGRLRAMVDADRPGPAARQAVIAGARDLRAMPDGEWPAEGHKAKRARVQEWARSEAGARAVRTLQRLHEDCRAACTGFRASLARRARASLSSRRDARRSYSFGDLIARTWALVSPPASALVAHARSRYAVAIIDECQDTDPLQQAIFSRIFDAPGHRLHVVGDPKQSIYGFRGADLPSYIRLRDSGAADDPLAVSFRSDAAHVAAVEGLFTAHASPFGSAAIAFTPISAKHTGARCIGGDGAPQSGVEAIALDAGTGVTSQRAAAMRAAAARIRQWLSLTEPSGLCVPEDGDPEGPRRPVRPGDIAVLCHRRDELDAMRRELDRLGIPSVYSGDSSVLLSPAAEDIHAILVACASRRSAQFAAGAAMTRALGATADDIRSRRESWIGAIRTCARTIERSGIDAALVELLERPIPDARAGADADRSAMELLLAQPGGERHAVDLQHLRELLGEAERPGVGAAAALARCIASQREALSRSGGRGGGDTARLRTQATRDAVTLQTLHSSKGLTYALVCLPTIAMGSRQPAEAPIVRTTEVAGDGTASRIIDFGSGAQADRARRQQEEQRLEQFRLLYVAMTRARYLTSVCVPLEPAPSARPSALEELLAAQCGADGAAASGRIDQLAAWARRSATAHARLDPATAAPAAPAPHGGEAMRGASLRIIMGAPTWAGSPWSAPSAAAMAPVDPAVHAWAEPLREASFTSLSRGVPHADPAAVADGRGDGREIDDRAERAEPDAGPAVAGTEPGAEGARAERGSASAIDDAIRRLGIRGVDLGVAMHAALDAAFASLADAGPDGAPLASDAAQDRLAQRIAGECAAVSGGDTLEATHVAAHDAARALRAALAQPLGHGCPSVVELAERRDAVLRELRISVPLDLDPRALADAFLSCGGEIGERVAPALRRSPAARVRGLLSGIIDIAAAAQPGEWHIIDWKTNDLGRDPRAYSGSALEDAAAGSLYPVQAALYMMLLARWLRRIGDASAVVASHYLYVRGMDPQTPGVGVWSWSPGDALVAAIDAAVGASAAAEPEGGSGGR